MPVEVKVEQRHKDEAVTLANRLNLTDDQFTSGIADVFARSFAQFEARLSHSASTREGEETRPLPTREEVAPPHHPSISLEKAIDVVRTGDTRLWTGAIYDHLRNYAALLQGKQP